MNGWLVAAARFNARLFSPIVPLPRTQNFRDCSPAQSDIQDDSDESPEDTLSDLLVVFGLIGLMLFVLLICIVTLPLVALTLWI
jgi:hypothetical protein